MIIQNTQFYLRGLELEILQSDASGDVKIGYATDTKSILISDNIRWYKVSMADVGDPFKQYSSTSSSSISSGSSTSSSSQTFVELTANSTLNISSLTENVRLQLDPGESANLILKIGAYDYLINAANVAGKFVFDYGNTHGIEHVFGDPPETYDFTLAGQSNSIEFTSYGSFIINIDLSSDGAFCVNSATHKFLNGCYSWDPLWNGYANYVQGVRMYNAQGLGKWFVDNTQGERVFEFNDDGSVNPAQNIHLRAAVNVVTCEDPVCIQSSYSSTSSASSISSRSSSSSKSSSSRSSSSSNTSSSSMSSSTPAIVVNLMAMVAAGTIDKMVANDVLVQFGLAPMFSSSSSNSSNALTTTVDGIRKMVEDGLLDSATADEIIRQLYMSSSSSSATPASGTTVGTANSGASSITVGIAQASSFSAGDFININGEVVQILGVNGSSGQITFTPSLTSTVGPGVFVQQVFPSSSSSSATGAGTTTTYTPTGGTTINVGSSNASNFGIGEQILVGNEVTTITNVNTVTGEITFSPPTTTTIGPGTTVTKYVTSSSSSSNIFVSGSTSGTAPINTDTITLPPSIAGGLVPGDALQFPGSATQPPIIVTVIDVDDITGEVTCDPPFPREIPPGTVVTKIYPSSSSSGSSIISSSSSSKTLVFGTASIQSAAGSNKVTVSPSEAAGFGIGSTLDINGEIVTITTINTITGEITFTPALVNTVPPGTVIQEVIISSSSSRSNSSSSISSVSSSSMSSSSVSSLSSSSISSSSDSSNSNSSASSISSSSISSSSSVSSSSTSSSKSSSSISSTSSSSTSSVSSSSKSSISSSSVSSSSISSSSVSSSSISSSVSSSSNSSVSSSSKSSSSMSSSVSSSSSSSATTYVIETIAYNKAWYTGNGIGFSANDNFGKVVAMSADGSTVAVAAPDYDSTSTSNSEGAVAIIRHYLNLTGTHAHHFNQGRLTTWDEPGTQNLTVPIKIATIVGPVNNGEDTTHISLSRDGQTVAIGSKEFSALGTQNGCIRVYRSDKDPEICPGPDGANYTQIGQFLTGNVPYDYMGSANSFELTADGNQLFVGMYGDDDDGSTSGSVRIFDYNSDTDNWDERPKLYAPVPQNYSYFGKSLDVCADGNTLAVGQPGYRAAGSASNAGEGLVHVFEQTGSLDRSKYTAAFNGDKITTNYEYGASTQLTFSFWIKSTDQDCHWLGNSTTGTFDSRLHLGVKGGKYYWLVGNSSSHVQFKNYLDASAVLDDAWHNITFVWNGSGSTYVKLYVDGVYTYQVQSIAAPTAAAGAPIFLGTGWDSIYDFEGEMASFAIWESILSDAEIANVYNAGIDGTLSNTAAWWRMGSDPADSAVHGQTFTSVTDSSGNGYNASSSDSPVHQYLDSRQWSAVGSPISGRVYSSGNTGDYIRTYAGHVVKISTERSDGKKVVTFTEEHGGDENGGAVRQFIYDGSWTERGTPYDAWYHDDFEGKGLAVSADGDTYISGAPGYDLSYYGEDGLLSYRVWNEPTGDPTIIASNGYTITGDDTARPKSNLFDGDTTSFIASSGAGVALEIEFTNPIPVTTLRLHLQGMGYNYGTVNIYNGSTLVGTKPPQANMPSGWYTIALSGSEFTKIQLNRHPSDGYGSGIAEIEVDGKTLTIGNTGGYFQSISFQQGDYIDELGLSVACDANANFFIAGSNYDFARIYKRSLGTYAWSSSRSSASSSSTSSSSVSSSKSSSSSSSISSSSSTTFTNTQALLLPANETLSGQVDRRSGDMTFAFWFKYHDSNSLNYSTIFWTRSSSPSSVSGNHESHLNVVQDPSNVLYGTMNSDGVYGPNGNWYANKAGTEKFVEGVWYHFAVTRESGSTLDSMKMYIDGVHYDHLDWTVVTGAYMFGREADGTTGHKFTLGNKDGFYATTVGFNDIVLFDSALTGSQIQEVYNEGRTRTFKDYGNNLAHHWPLEGNLQDYVGGKDLTQTGSQTYEYITENSIGLDGVDQWMELTTPQTLLHSDVWSTSFWFYVEDPASLSARLDYNLMNGIPSQGNTRFIRIVNYPIGDSTYASGGWNLSVNSTRHNVPPVYTTAQTYGYASWHHCAVTCDGTTISLYMDGVLYSSAPSISGTSSDTRYMVGAIGSHNAGFGPFQAVKLDDFKIWTDHCLTDQEASLDYVSAITSYTERPYGFLKNPVVSTSYVSTPKTAEPDMLWEVLESDATSGFADTGSAQHFQTLGTGITFPSVTDGRLPGTYAWDFPTSTNSELNLLGAEWANIVNGTDFTLVYDVNPYDTNPTYGQFFWFLSTSGGTSNPFVLRGGTQANNSDQNVPHFPTHFYNNTNGDSIGTLMLKSNHWNRVVIIKDGTAGKMHFIVSSNATQPSNYGKPAMTATVSINSTSSVNGVANIGIIGRHSVWSSAGMPAHFKMQNFGLFSRALSKTEGIVLASELTVQKAALASDAVHETYFQTKRIPTPNHFYRFETTQDNNGVIEIPDDGSDGDNPMKVNGTTAPEIIRCFFSSSSSGLFVGSSASSSKSSDSSDSSKSSDSSFGTTASASSASSLASHGSHAPGASSGSYGSASNTSGGSYGGTSGTSGTSGGSYGGTSSASSAGSNMSGGTSGGTSSASSAGSNMSGGTSGTSGGSYGGVSSASSAGSNLSESSSSNSSAGTTNSSTTPAQYAAAAAAIQGTNAPLIVGLQRTQVPQFFGSGMVNGVEFKVLDPRAEVEGKVFTVTSSNRNGGWWYAMGEADADGYQNVNNVHMGNWTQQGALYTFSVAVNSEVSNEVKFRVMLQNPMGGSVVGGNSDVNNTTEPWVNVTTAANNTWAVDLSQFAGSSSSSGSSNSSSSGVSAQSGASGISGTSGASGGGTVIQQFVRGDAVIGGYNNSEKGVVVGFYPPGSASLASQYSGVNTEWNYSVVWEGCSDGGALQSQLSPDPSNTYTNPNACYDTSSIGSHTYYPGDNVTYNGHACIVLQVLPWNMYNIYDLDDSSYIDEVSGGALS